MAISLAAVVVLQLRLDRTRRVFARYMKCFRQRDAVMDESIDLVIGIVRELLEVAATSSIDKDLFMRRLSRALFLNPEDPKSVVHNLDVIADCRFYGVMTHLKENNYRLSKDDLIFCSMICFDFTQPVISMLYGHTNDQSYYNRRLRLRNRLGINKDGEHIRTYLKHLTQTLKPEKL